MTPEAQLALIAAIAPTIAAVGAIVVVIVGNSRAGKKLDHITVLTNSTLTAANKRIEELENIVMRLVSERDNKTPQKP